MRVDILAISHNQALIQRNIFFGVALISMIVNLLMGGINFYLVGKERIVVTPAVINNEFWVSSDTVSDSYLEQMSGLFIGLALDISPSNFSKRSEQLLRHVHPSDYSLVKAQLVAQQAEIERRAMSTSFYPISFKIDRKKLIVEVKGELRIMIGGASMDVKTKTYQIPLMLHQGRLYVKQIKEVTNDR